MGEDRETPGGSPTLANIRALRRARERSLNIVALGVFGGGMGGVLLVAWAMSTRSTASQGVAALWIFVAVGTILAGLESAKNETLELAQHEKDDENRRRYVQMALSGEHYVLWLRDFSPEGAVMHSGPAGSTLYTHEDPVESSIVSDICSQLPTLALANPRYTDPNPPADRVWVHSSQWLTIVEGYARHASAVVLCAKHISPGVRAELDMLASTGLLDRTWLALSSTARSQLASDSPAVLQSARWVTRLGSRTPPPLNPVARYLWDRNQIRSGETTDPTPPAFLAYLRELPKRPVRRVRVECDADILLRMTDVLEHALSQVPTAEDAKGVLVLTVKSQRQ